MQSKERITFCFFLYFFLSFYLFWRVHTRNEQIQKRFKAKKKVIGHRTVQTEMVIHSCKIKQNDKNHKAKLNTFGMEKWKREEWRKIMIKNPEKTHEMHYVKNSNSNNKVNEIFTSLARRWFLRSGSISARAKN